MAKKKKAKRNYAQEYRDFHGTPKQIARRANTNWARKKLGLKKGDPREVDHKVPLSKGGSNKKSNLRAVSRKTNRKKATKTVSTAKKAKVAKRKKRRKK